MSFYVYILELKWGKHYVGFTGNLQDRMRRHELGHVKYTSGHLPIRLVWYASFEEQYTAVQFEKYLKKGSGRAFAKKHLY